MRLRIPSAVFHFFTLCLTCTTIVRAADVDRWLQPQHWVRDVDGPVVSLGSKGQFDDTHIFAPCVARHDDSFLLWYCGSRGDVANRVFRMGLARSDDGRHFAKSDGNPVASFGPGNESILTPTLLRNENGDVVRKQGEYVVYFSSCDFPGGDSRHTLHRITSSDGMAWSPPSPALLEHVYAPSLIFDGGVYRLWYVDVSAEPWSFRYAESSDGRNWTVDSKPILEVDQAWESGRLFYPAVVKADGVYLMWYGSYWSAHKNKTALGFAVSGDGRNWTKFEGNPVFTPAPERAWESHYTTSQSVMRLDDGSWRMWYASRTAPPFTHKYFAIGTARWTGPDVP